MTIDERFRNDPEFCALVKNFEALISSAKFTPSEIREAALLAQIRYEMYNPRPVEFSPQLYEEIKFRLGKDRIS